MLKLEKLDIGDNKKRILKEIFDRRELTRAELVSLTGLSNLTVTKLVSELLRQELIVEKVGSSNSVGRHPTNLAINPDHKYIVSIDIGSYCVNIAIVKFNGEILESKDIKNDDTGPLAIVMSVDELCKEINKYVKKYGASQFIGVAVGISGLVDYSKGKVVFCPNLDGYNDICLEEKINKKTGLPARVDTTARNMAFGEMNFGVGKSYKNQIYVSIGNRTISSGIIVDSKIYRGANGFAGELGHNRISSLEDFICTCGSYGCLEISASMKMVERRISKALENYGGYSPAKTIIKDLADITPEEIVESYEMGDTIVMNTVEEAANDIGKVLADAVNFFEPELVTLGGGFVEHMPKLVTMIERNVKGRSLTPIRQYLKIKKSELGANASLLGGAMQLVGEYIE